MIELVRLYEGDKVEQFTRMGVDYLRIVRGRAYRFANALKKSDGAEKPAKGRRKQ